MKIIFLTLVRITSAEQKGNYQDLIRKFRDEGNEIIIVSPTERRFGEATSLKVEGNVTLLQVWTPNIQKTNIFEKSYIKSRCCLILPRRVDLPRRQELQK